MTKVTAPLLAFDAFGKWAETVVFDRRRGVNVAIKYSKPTGAPTATQEQMRDAMRWLNDAWLHRSSVVPVVFAPLAQQTNIPQRQLWLQANLAAAKSATSTSPIPGFRPRFTPPKPLAELIWQIGGQLVYSITWPPAPPNYTPVGLNFFAWQEQLPRGDFTPPMLAAGNIYPAAACAAVVPSGGLVWNTIAYTQWTDPKDRHVFSEPFWGSLLVP